LVGYARFLLCLGFWGIGFLIDEKQSNTYRFDSNTTTSTYLVESFSKHKNRILRSLKLVLHHPQFENGQFCRRLLIFALNNDIIDVIRLLASNENIDFHCILAPIIKHPFHHVLWKSVFARVKYSIPKIKPSLEELLFLAIGSKNENIIHDLLHHPFIDPNALDGYRDTFLQVALGCRLNIGLVKDFIRSGVDITHANKYGSTAMAIARRNSDIRAFTLLLSIHHKIGGDPIPSKSN